MRHPHLVACGAAACLLAACSASGLSHPSTLPPVDTVTVVRVGGAATLPAPTFTTAADPLPASGHSTPAEVVLSAGGPWRLVDSAPGITTPGLFYELLPQVWVYLPTVEDIPHDVLWTFNEEDRPVVEGYLRAQAVRLHAGANVVLRPQVLGDGSSDTTAIVADCVRPATTDGAPIGWGFDLVVRGDAWVVSTATTREDACWAA